MNATEHEGYTGKYICGRTLVEVVETSSCIDATRTYSVVSGDGGNWTVRLPHWNDPGVAVHDEEIFVWGGCCCWMLKAGAAAKRVQFDEEVCAVYKEAGGGWVITELSVLLYDFDRDEEVDRYTGIADVVIRHWWDGEKLLVRTWTGALHSLKVKADGHLDGRLVSK